MDGLSILIPVYNEKGSIESTLDNISSVMESSSINFEIIVINDGSTDGTTELLNGRRDSADVRVITHSVNKGYGASLKTGVKHSKYTSIAITDADGTYPNHKIPELYHELGTYDMVIGARAFKSLPRKTKPAKWMILKLANYIAKEDIPDINSGLRLFRKNSFIPFLPIIPDGFSLTTTITLGMLTGGFDVAFVPIEYYCREGKSKIQPIRDTLRFLKLILKIGLYIAPLKIFVPFGIFVFLLGMFWAVFSYLVLGRFADTSTIVIIMTSLQIMLLALIAELINHRTQNYYKKTVDSYSE
ncbi:MAG: glycosyltransferase family 2 protein [Bacteroidota bacterium]